MLGMFAATSACPWFPPRLVPAKILDRSRPCSLSRCATRRRVRSLRPRRWPLLAKQLASPLRPRPLERARSRLRLDDPSHIAYALVRRSQRRRDPRRRQAATVRPTPSSTGPSATPWAYGMLEGHRLPALSLRARCAALADVHLSGLANGPVARVRTLGTRCCIDGRWGLVDTTLGTPAKARSSRTSTSSRRSHGDGDRPRSGRSRPGARRGDSRSTSSRRRPYSGPRPGLAGMNFDAADLTREAERSDGIEHLRSIVPWNHDMRVALQTDAGKRRGCCPGAAAMANGASGTEIRRLLLRKTARWLGSASAPAARWKPLWRAIRSRARPRSRLPTLMTRFYDSNSTRSNRPLQARPSRRARTTDDPPSCPRRFASHRLPGSRKSRGCSSATATTAWVLRDHAHLDRPRLADHGKLREPESLPGSPVVQSSLGDFPRLRAPQPCLRIAEPDISVSAPLSELQSEDADFGSTPGFLPPHPHRFSSRDTGVPRVERMIVPATRASRRSEKRGCRPHEPSVSTMASLSLSPS